MFTRRVNNVCSYEHNNIDEPAILLGGSFVVDVVESVKCDRNIENTES
jgi:hypothetical protein